MDLQKNVRIERLFKRIFALWVAKEDGYRFRCISLLYEIFAELQSARGTPRRHAEKIQKAVDEIHENFLTKSFRMEELAALCGMKISYFTRLFKELYGMPPAKYIIHYFLSRASRFIASIGYAHPIKIR